MLFKSELLAQTSGSLDGTTFSHNRYGRYTRRRATPTNPNSTAQASIRQGMAMAHVAWVALSAAVKQGWDDYAAGTPVVNRLGETIYLTGRAMFVRQYVLRKYSGITQITTAPTSMGLCVLSTPTAVYDISDAQVTLNYNAADGWNTTTGGFLNIAVAQPQSSGVSFFKGPYILASAVEGNTAAPPASPKLFTPPYVYSANHKLFLRCMAVDSEGRISAPYLFQGTIQA